ncbi:MAG: PTS sugar transporter subunit IIA [Cardiobacteriaceae bacterium]|nr:PTS sugar transporter subunit IIA [Cardiobacteriaceae bacterium]
MTAFIITGHGQFADGLYSALEIIGGSPKNVHVVNFLAGDTPEALSEKLAKIVKLYDNSNVVIFCDIIGGAPFRQAALLAQHWENSDVVYGTTLQMLVEGVLERERIDSARDLVAQLLPSAREGIGSLSSYAKRTPPSTQTEEGL